MAASNKQLAKTTNKKQAQALADYSTGVSEYDNFYMWPIMDGSQQISHTTYMLRQFDRSQMRFDELREVSKEASSQIYTGRQLVRDVWDCLYGGNPRLLNSVKRIPIFKLNRQICQKIVADPYFETLREIAQTVNNSGLTSFFTAQIVTDILNNLDAETKEQYASQESFNQANQKAKGAGGKGQGKSSKGEQGDGQDGEGDEQEGEGQEQTDNDNNSDNELSDEEFAQKYLGGDPDDKFGDDEQDADEGEAEGDDPEVNLDLGDAVRAAMQQVEVDINNFIAMHPLTGSGWGKGKSESIFNSDNLADKIKAAKKLSKNQHMKELAQALGRMKRIAREVKMTKSKYGYDNVSGVEMGRNLERVPQHQLALLAHPDTAKLFALDFVRGRLQNYTMEGRERVGRGPFIIATDISGSMSGYGEVWAVAVTMTMLEQAHEDGERDSHCIFFDDRVDTTSLPNSNPTAKQKEYIMTRRARGGTDFENVLIAIMGLVRQGAVDADCADGAFITDGVARVSDGVLKKWDEFRRETGFRMSGVLIGTEDGYGTLGRISDTLITIADLTDDSKALDLLFNIN